MTAVPSEGPNAWVDMFGGLPDKYTYTELERYYSGRQRLAFMAPEVLRAVRGRLTPRWRKTYWTNPEQSKPFGVVPPNT